MKLAKFFQFETEEDLTPASGTGPAMPFDHVWMPPGHYSLGGEVWNCQRTGLYRFMTDNEPFFRNRIVFGSGPPIDIYASVSAMCWNHIHGAADENRGDLPTIMHWGRYAVWRLRCGHIGNLMAWLVPQLGYEGRQVSVWTLETPNGYDDGHQVYEIMIDGKHRMFDLTDGCYWRDGNGDHMSTAELVAAISGGAPMPTMVKLDGNQRRWDHEVAPGSLFDQGLYGDNFLNTEAKRIDRVRRVFQAWAVM